jgi:hypothetical protein
MVAGIGQESELPMIIWLFFAGQFSAHSSQLRIEAAVSKQGDT